MSKVSIIKLGMHPFADTFISEKYLGSPEPVYSLECLLDTETGHVSVKYPTKAKERYNLYDYSYTASNSKVSRDHWDIYSIHVPDKLKLPKGSAVLEIGSNDGYLLGKFCDRGYTASGVDSAYNMCSLAREKGLNTYCGIFSKDTATTLVSEGVKVDLVVANNVYNHANDPVDFALGVKEVLNPGGVFVFEVPYWYNTITDKKFDQIYHEHVSYFTVKSACNVLASAGLEVFDVEWIPYHGGSIRVYASADNSKEKANDVKAFITREEEARLFDPSMYKNFMHSITFRRNTFLQKLYSIATHSNAPIVGVGAAAKGNTFLNFYNLDSTIIDYVTDSSEFKIGKYTPLSRIPIESDEVVFSKYSKVYAIILSWNISEHIKEKLKGINENIEFITP
jgi:SAM-dependent methyltransferase